jgi:hypothetical protein
LTGVAVKVTDVPGQTGLAEAEMMILTILSGVHVSLRHRTEKAYAFQLVAKPL